MLVLPGHATPMAALLVAYVGAGALEGTGAGVRGGERRGWGRRWAGGGAGLGQGQTCSSLKGEASAQAIWCFSGGKKSFAALFWWIVVNSDALSGAFLVVVFCRWWSILALFLVLFWCSCFVDGGQFWCSCWCFFGARVL